MSDPHRFVRYYENQVGGALPGFAGAPVMYGRGIGSLFSRLFRFISPLVKKGFALAKPHLKSAAKNIATDVISHAAAKVRNSEDGVQEGSGGIMVMSRRPRKRPPGQRVASVKKRTRTVKKKSVGRSRSKRRTVSKALQDIF